ncbi:hypothetical protein E2C01_091013 [Portunus trituberculatus]|uniref:Uncharacterized protein n=1 Tax=Portunus trituberculatus TaxID=210409 RepID=A0A5B7JRN2_PORTR|nr:hypothetical protein [Portunus trituberculatus]
MQEADWLSAGRGADGNSCGLELVLIIQKRRKINGLKEMEWSQAASSQPAAKQQPTSQPLMGAGR